MKILVTGGSGHIGESLCLSLDQAGHEIINWNYRHTEKEKNLEQLDLLLEGMDMVIHTLAFTSSFGPKSTYHELNIELTRKIMSLAIQREVSSFLYLSDARLDWIDPSISTYFMSKYHAEKFVLKLAETKKIKTMAIRLPLVMGINNKSKWQQEVLEKAHKNALYLIGGGDNKRDMMYVTDVANGLVGSVDLLHSSHEHNGKCYRLSAGALMTWEEILLLNLKLAGLDSGLNYMSPMKAKILAGFYERLYLFLGIYRPIPFLTKSFYLESLHDDSENTVSTPLMPKFMSQMKPENIRALIAQHRQDVDQIFKRI